MSFADLTNSLLAACQGTFGQAVNYTDLNGEVYELSGIFGSEFESVDAESGYQIMSSSPHIGIVLKNWPKMPEENERISISSRRYAVRHSEPDGEGGAVVFLKAV